MVKSACGIEAVYMCFNGTGIWGGETFWIRLTAIFNFGGHLVLINIVLYMRCNSLKLNIYWQAFELNFYLKITNGITKNRIVFISMAAILYFSILRLIPYFDSVDPVLIGFSMLWTPYMQVFIRKCTCWPPDVTYLLSYERFCGNHENRSR